MKIKTNEFEELKKSYEKLQNDYNTYIKKWSEQINILKKKQQHYNWRFNHRKV